jgi:hypothetical protein
MIVTSHSDAPVALPNLLQVMNATVNRTSRSGKIMGPDERLRPLEALKAVTLWGAYSHFEEDCKGSLLRHLRCSIGPAIRGLWSLSNFLYPRGKPKINDLR